MKDLETIEAVRAYARHATIGSGQASEPADIAAALQQGLSIQAARNYARLASNLGTQGRKGQKLARYNLGLTAENKEFIQIYANATGQTQNALINSIIDAYWREHPDAVAAVAKARAAWDIITEE